MKRGSGHLSGRRIAPDPIPASITVEGDTIGGGTPSGDTIASFLGGATVSDTVDTSPSLTNDAPPLFPLGDTIVTFSGTDAQGNISTDTATVIPEIVSELRCSAARTLDLAGQARTDQNGVHVWRLTEHVCTTTAIDEPITLVATPTAEAARFPFPTQFDPPERVFLTVEYSISADARELTANIKSWTHDGEIAGGVPFSYRGLFRIVPIID